MFKIKNVGSHEFRITAEIDPELQFPEFFSGNPEKSADKDTLSPTNSFESSDQNELLAMFPEILSGPNPQPMDSHMLLVVPLEAPSASSSIQVGMSKK